MNPAAWILHTEVSPDYANNERDDAWFSAWLAASGKWPLWANGDSDVSTRYEPGVPLTLAGYGAFGVVLRARLRRTQETVAVKMFALPFTALSANETVAQRRFRTAALAELRALEYLRTLGACDSANVACLVDYFEARIGQRLFALIAATPRAPRATLTDPMLIRPFIETRWVDGYSMRQRMQSDVTFSGLRRTARYNVALCLSAARALRFMHADARLIHSDIKPDNIVVEESGMPVEPRCVLIDMNLACRVGGVSGEVGTCDALNGSKFWFAPERFAHIRDPATLADASWISFDERAAWDVYGLGASFFDYGWHLPRPTRVDRLNPPFFPVAGDTKRGEIATTIEYMTTELTQQRATIGEVVSALEIVQTRLRDEMPPATQLPPSELYVVRKRGAPSSPPSASRGGSNGPRAGGGGVDSGSSDYY